MSTTPDFKRLPKTQHPKALNLPPPPPEPIIPRFFYIKKYILFAYLVCTILFYLLEIAKILIDDEQSYSQQSSSNIDDEDAKCLQLIEWIKAGLQIYRRSIYGSSLASYAKYILVAIYAGGIAFQGLFLAGIIKENLRLSSLYAGLLLTNTIIILYNIALLISSSSPILNVLFVAAEAALMTLIALGFVFDLRRIAQNQKDLEDEAATTESFVLVDREL